jgi:hypothetical protein
MSNMAFARIGRQLAVGDPVEKTLPRSRLGSLNRALLRVPVRRTFHSGGDHHIFSKPGVADILNLQPRDSQAKPYQVKQVRSVIIRYNWRKGPNDEIRDHPLLER